MTALTPIDATTYRGRVYAATSLDGQWEYRNVSGTLWSVTHASTGRRYWVVGLDQARTETGDGTAAKLLDAGKPLPPGKPLARGEYHAICAELSARDCERMLADLAVEVPDLVDAATRRTRTVPQTLGVIYGDAPYAWVDALQAVRPDLLPPHLTQQKAA